MNYQSIKFIYFTEKHKPLEFHDSFALRPDRPAPWLQKACFWVLRQLGAFNYGCEVEVKRHEINVDIFMEKLIRQNDNIIQFFGYKPTTLLIGAEDFSKLMREEAVTRMFHFGARYHVDGKVMGLTVRVIPWMQGCLVLPDFC